MPRTKASIKIKQLLKDDKIMCFDTLKDMKEYFNIYDYQNFKTYKEMLSYIDGYYFKYNKKHYCCNYDGILDQIKPIL